MADQFTSGVLIILVIVFLISLLAIIIIMRLVERTRIPKLQEAMLATYEGAISEGGKVLIWDPGDWVSTLAAYVTALFSLFIAYFILDSFGIQFDLLTFGLISEFISFNFSILYYYGIYYRRSARRVLIMDNSGLTEVFVINRTERKSYPFLWQDIKEIYVNSGLGGDYAADNGIVIKTKKRYIYVDRKLKNSALLFNELVERYPRSFLSYAVWSYLASRSSKDNQEYLCGSEHHHNRMP